MPGGTSAGRGEIIQGLGGFGRDVHFHGATVRLRKLSSNYSRRVTQVVDLLIHLAIGVRSAVTRRGYSPSEATRGSGIDLRTD